MSIKTHRIGWMVAWGVVALFFVGTASHAVTIPEPSTLLLAALSLVGLSACARGLCR